MNNRTRAALAAVALGIGLSGRAEPPDPDLRHQINRFWRVAEEDIAHRRAVPSAREAEPASLPRPRLERRAGTDCEPAPRGRALQGSAVTIRQEADRKSRRRRLAFNILGDINLFNITAERDDRRHRDRLDGQP